MQAIQLTEPGPPEVLQAVELPEPEPGAGQVEVRLRAAGVNPIDTKLRSRGVFFERGLPAILGCDGAGTVQRVGADVTTRHAGARVCATVGSEANARFVESLGAELAVNYREQSFIDAVLDWTDGRGVDVALDIMGVQVFVDSFRDMAH